MITHTSVFESGAVHSNISKFTLAVVNMLASVVCLALCQCCHQVVPSCQEQADKTTSQQAKQGLALCVEPSLCWMALTSPPSNMAYLVLRAWRSTLSAITYACCHCQSPQLCCCCQSVWALGCGQRPSAVPRTATKASAQWQRQWQCQWWTLTGRRSVHLCVGMLSPQQHSWQVWLWDVVVTVSASHSPPLSQLAITKCNVLKRLLILWAPAHHVLLPSAHTCNEITHTHIHLDTHCLSCIADTCKVGANLLPCTLMAHVPPAPHQQPAYGPLCCDYCPVHC